MSTVRDLDVAAVRGAVAHLLVDANYNIPPDVLEALRAAVVQERSPLARRTLEQIVRNYEVAAIDRVPVCQDSGVTVVLLDVGQDVHFTGGSLNDAIYAGIREGTRAGYLRQSVTGDPTRLLKMAGDEAPGVVHIELVPGDRVQLMVASKGFGGENMSALRMLVPGDGAAGIGDGAHGLRIHPDGKSAPIACEGNSNEIDSIAPFC